MPYPEVPIASIVSLMCVFTAYFKFIPYVARQLDRKLKCLRDFKNLYEWS